LPDTFSSSTTCRQECRRHSFDADHHLPTLRIRRACASHPTRHGRGTDRAHPHALALDVHSFVPSSARTTARSGNCPPISRTNPGAPSQPRPSPNAGGSCRRAPIACRPRRASTWCSGAMY
jgi:hypothetical protein